MQNVHISSDISTGYLTMKIPFKQSKSSDLGFGFLMNKNKQRSGIG